MRVLIMTCNTGGGHNACSKALQDMFTENGHSCEVVDAVGFVSEKLSKFLDWGHTTMYRHIPKLFRFGYGFAEKHPAMLDEDAAVYKLLTDGTKQLHSYIETGQFDTVICAHVFSGLLIRQLLKEYPMKLKTAFVATDYTCSPGAANGELDYYFIPAESLTEEFIAQGVPEEKIIASGIPVRSEFYGHGSKAQAKQALGIDSRHTHLLMMCGSMGCGPIEKLTKLFSRQMATNMELTIVCGSNEKLKEELTETFGALPNIHIHGFVRDISTVMDSADLYLTKPGGLSTTEAAAKRLPMVFIDAVAGCEKYNLNYFVSLGGAVTADGPEDLAKLCTELMQDPIKRSAMAIALETAIPPNAAQQIYDAMKELPEFKPTQKEEIELGKRLCNL